jgi:hypothetical protein
MNLLFLIWLVAAAAWREKPDIEAAIIALRDVILVRHAPFNAFDRPLRSD